MEINWFYFSDTNTPPGEIEEILTRKNHTLNSVLRLEDLHQHIIQDDKAILFIKAITIYNVYDLCREISVMYPHVYIVLIVPDNMENVKKAMHAGASDILRTSYEFEDLLKVIVQAEKYMTHRAKKEKLYSPSLLKSDSRVISICSTKGGAGRTTLIVNFATALAKKGKKVAVIDADLQFGDIAMYYDLKPKRTIYEWVKEGYGYTHSAIDQYMSKHECGLYVLAAPPRPEFFEIIKEEHIKAAIDECKKMFDVILIDTSAYLSEIHLSCLKKSDEILILTSNDLPALRNSKLFIDTLESLNLKGNTKLILNRQTKLKTLEPQKIEGILGMSIYTVIPSQESVVNPSVNQGTPFVLTHAKTPVAKAIFSLIDKLFIEDNHVLEAKKKNKRNFFIRK
ncbi:AAA family ATPase [Gottfriedia sp. NPDC058432]|uniref:AAA family ATPase n=1 Tax=Gottfriedia sp. NPDC058432 TaxID=3346497 RepID=UPI0036613EB4